MFHFVISVFFCIGNIIFAATWNKLFNYVIIYFLTKVEPNYANDSQDSNPESSEDAEEQLSKVRCESYSSEKDKRNSYDGKVQQ